MGLVFKGLDPKINRPVALKVIRSSTLAKDKEIHHLRPMERFMVEAQAAGRLSHPAIVTIYDVGEETLQDGSLSVYIAMEFLEGKGLDWHIKNKTYKSLDKKLQIIKEIAEGMEYAHRHSVIHRDLKPSNIIMVEGDHPKITDFGLARVPDSSLTLSGAIMGTPSYMSPEQIYGKRVDARTDIFSLTVILYELVTGEKPFTGSNITSIIFNVINQDPTLPTSLDPALPPVLNSLIQRGLSKELEGRFSNFTEYLGALNLVMGALPAGESAISAKPIEKTAGIAVETPFQGHEETPVTVSFFEGEVTQDFIPAPAKQEEAFLEPSAGEEPTLEIPASMVRQKGDTALKAKFSKLLSKFPHISYSMDENMLAERIEEMLTKMGFYLHAGITAPMANLARQINYETKRGHLYLLLYKPKQSGYNLVDLFRELLRLNPTIDMGVVIPIFRSTVTSEQQHTLFKFLADFGVKYAVFLTPNVVLDQNIAEIMSDLVRYADLDVNGFSVREKQLPEIKKNGTEDIDTYRGLLALGESLMRSGQFEEAIKVFTEAVLFKPDFALLVNRGDAYYKIRRYVPALNDYREANRLNQTAPIPYAKIGACCLIMARREMEEDNTEKARNWFEVGIKRLLESERLIEQYERQNRATPEKLAKNPYAALLSAMHEVDFEITGLDDIKNRLAELAARLAYKTRNMEADDPETDLEMLLDRALILAASGNQAEAEKIFRSALKRDPAIVAPAFNNYAVTLRKAGEYGRAYEIYLELLKYTIPEKHIVLENMKTAGLRHALQLRNMGRFEDAKMVYKTILVQNPMGKEWVLCELASTDLETGDQPEACSRLIEALFHNPGLMKSEEFNSYPELEKLHCLILKRLNQAKE
ncbi:MAG: protein kinase [Nitrospinae bacterium]|nr:protein kinase [Nitrospinota bacterium]